MGTKSHPLFWNLIDLHDPDYLHCYKRTGRDIEIEEPERFQKAVEMHVAAWEKHIGETAHPAAIDGIREDLQHRIETTFEINPELQNQLKKRIAPFYFQQWIVEAGWLSADSVPRHPNTDVADILSEIDHSSNVLAIGKMDQELDPLWCGAAFGRVNAKFQERLKSIGIETVELGPPYDGAPNTVRMAVSGLDDPHSIAYWAGTSTQEVVKWLNAAPWALSKLALGGYRSTAYPYWQMPAIAVAGNTIEDFCFYFALSRMRERVVWILPSITESVLSGSKDEPKIDNEFHFATALANLARGDSQHHAGLAMTSLSLSDEQLEDVRDRIEHIGFRENLDCRFESPGSLLPSEPLRYLEANNASRPRFVSVPEEGIISLFETPVPKNFNRVNPSKHRWISELSISQYHLPRHSSLGWWMMGSGVTTTKDVRVSSAGPSYFCPHNFIMSGDDVETSVIRPSIKVPQPLEIFEVIAQSASLTCAVSDKGFYADESCRKFGGLSHLTSFLRSHEGRAIGSAFLDKSPSLKGDHSKGFLLDDRRYLDYQALKAAIGDLELTTKTIDDLLRRGVLYRGFVLKCQYCKRTDWFAVGSITDSFTCPRCHSEQIYTSTHWMNGEHPSWFYQLDEIVYQGLSHDMDVPLLALDRLRREANDNLIAVSELRYFDGVNKKPFIESDLNCVVDGILTIGEAKKADRLAKTEKEELAIVTSYLDLANRLGARQLVFATTAEKWRAKTLENTLQILVPGSIRLRILTHAELCG